MIRFVSLLVLVAACALTATRHASAAIQAFTTRASFDTAISGMGTQTLDFESLSPGTVITSGDTVEGITFDFNIFGLDMVVADSYDTTSGANYLGLNDGDFTFLDGDAFTMSFANPVNAVGMYFIASDPLLVGDITLETVFGSAVNSDVEESTLNDGGLVYFLGLVDTDNPFSSVDVSHDADPEVYFAYNVDDITTGTVPEPSTMLIWFGLGALGLMAHARCRRRVARSA